MNEIEKFENECYEDFIKLVNHYMGKILKQNPNLDPVKTREILIKKLLDKIE